MVVFRIPLRLLKRELLRVLLWALPQRACGILILTFGASFFASGESLNPVGMEVAPAPAFQAAHIGLCERHTAPVSKQGSRMED